MCHLPQATEPNIEHASGNGPEDAQALLSEISGMQVEVPFVPVSQRRIVQIVEDDSIVVVGQVRQKKRKRAKPPIDELTPMLTEGSSPKNKLQTDETGTRDNANNHEPFDFTTVSNILDDNPDVEDTKQKRQKKQKSGKDLYLRAWLILAYINFRWSFLWRLPCST